MLEYDRSDVSEGTDTNKIGGSRQCIICHYWHFLKINFRFQPKECDGCHFETQRFLSFDDSEIVTVSKNGYGTLKLLLLVKMIMELSFGS